MCTVLQSTVILPSSDSKYYLRIFLLFVVLGIPCLEASLPACKLCTNTSISCSKQVPHYGLADDDCQMKYYRRNGEECSSLVLDSPSDSYDIGKVSLKSYIYDIKPGYQTAFNVSFEDINWTNITMRFMRNGRPENNTCREFHVSEKFLKYKPATLFYDCIWSTYLYEGKTYYFEYLARNSSTSAYSKYIFKVPENGRINPRETDLNMWEVFMYVDITNLPEIILRFQTLPKRFNVSTYLLKRYNNDACDESKTFIASEDDNIITYKSNFGILPGNYHFTVQPISPKCRETGCYESKSPDIKRYLPFHLIYVCITFLAVMLLTLVCVYVKLKIHILPEKDTELSARPTLLLIYRSTHSSHIKVVKELARNLRNNFNINALVDEIDVKSEDPFRWYNDTVAYADFIAIVSSPTCCDSISGIYPKLYETALNLLRGKVFNKEQLWKTYNLMVFLLPYCSDKDLPLEAKNIGLRYKIPIHINEVADYIHGSKKKGFLLKSYQCIKTKITLVWDLACNKSSYHKKHVLTEIQAAIQEASTEVSKCLSEGCRLDVDADSKCKSIDGKIMALKKEDIPIDHDKLFEMEENASEHSLIDNCEPFQDFPGPLDNFDLLTPNTEIVEVEKLDKKSSFMLDDLIL